MRQGSSDGFGFLIECRAYVTGMAAASLPWMEARQHRGVRLFATHRMGTAAWAATRDERRRAAGRSMNLVRR